MDYSFFYKIKIDNVDENAIFKNFEYDLFISAYNECERVNFVFDNVNAKLKHWLVFPEYNFKPLELAKLKDVFYNFSDSKLDEAEIIKFYFEKEREHFEGLNKVCIDITGFLRPYLVFLLIFLKKQGVKNIDFTYSEPKNYIKKENTLFSDEFIEIREIRGCLNSHNPETNNDLLIIGSGYDYRMIANIASSKPEARKVQVLGFPPLQADMFQENIIKIFDSQEDMSSGDFSIDSKQIILAPANDPFITAELISKFVKKEEKKKPFTNIYLSPLSTKAQTLGIALFYSEECSEKPASIIFPFCKKYSRETSQGISRIWIYKIEF